MEGTKINPGIVEKAKRDGNLQQEIANVAGKHYLTVYRWFNTQNKSLLRADILSVISKHYNISVEKILSNETLNLS